MDAMEALRAIVTKGRKPDTSDGPDLRPEPSPTPRGKTLADLLKPRVTPKPTGPTVPYSDLLSRLKRESDNPVQAPPPKLFSGISQSSGPAPTSDPPRGLFARIGEVGPKPRKRPTTWRDEEEKREPVVKLSLLLLQEMEAKGIEWKPRAGSKVADAHFRAGVQETSELKRILAIARRPPNLEMFPDQTEKYRRPEGKMHLWPIQNAVLVEAGNANGLLGPIRVGGGKTLASLLVGVAMNAKKIVLLVPPQLRTQLLEHDIPLLNKHWKLPLDRLRVVAYSELSHAKTAEILEQEKPDLIVADEGHNLRHKDASRTKRFLRYMKDHPECRFVVLSGTLTRRSLKDYQHLAELALHKNSPLPAFYPQLVDWAMALDVSKKEPMPPGALLQLCNDDELTKIASTPMPHDAQVYVRQAFRRRLIETPGVIATEEGALGTSLVITGLYPEVPAEVKVAIMRLYKTWQIDDEELMDALSLTRIATQLSAGFYYRWVWPNGEKDYTWLEARKAWNKEVRDILKLSKRGLDSPLLITNAVLRGELESGTYAAWAAVKGRYNPEPPKEAVWLSKFLVRAAVEWARTTCTKAAPGIIWYTHDVFGREVAKEGALPFFGPGNKAAEELARINVKKDHVIVASAKAHGTGKNLQMFSRNLFTTPSPGGADWEQTIARTHRPGQEADEVFVDAFLHTDEMMKAYYSAIKDAKYIEQTQGQKQKILYAKKVRCGFGQEE